MAGTVRYGTERRRGRWRRLSRAQRWACRRPRRSAGRRRRCRRATLRKVFGADEMRVEALARGGPRAVERRVPGRHGSVGFGQEHAAASGRWAGHAHVGERAPAGAGSGRARRRRPDPGEAAADRLRVPVLQPAAHPDRRRERRAAAGDRRRQGVRSRAPRRRSARAGRVSPTGATTVPANSRAASSSGWPSPGPW